MTPSCLGRYWMTWRQSLGRIRFSQPSSRIEVVTLDLSPAHHGGPRTTRKSARATFLPRISTDPRVAAPPISWPAYDEYRNRESRGLLFPWPGPVITFSQTH